MSLSPVSPAERVPVTCVTCCTCPCPLCHLLNVSLSHVSPAVPVPVLFVTRCAIARSHTLPVQCTTGCLCPGSVYHRQHAFLVLCITTYWRQKEKFNIDPAFDHSKPSGDKLFTHFLVLVHVCREPMSGKTKISKQLELFVISSSDTA